MLSRVADSLYWMSRYIERAEHTAPPDRRQAGIHGRADARTMPQPRWARVVAALRPAKMCRDDPTDAFAITTRAGLRPATIRSSLITSLALARDNARQVREALSNEVWEHLNRLYLRLAAGDHGFDLGASTRPGCSARRWTKCRRWKA